MLRHPLWIVVCLLWLSLPVLAQDLDIEGTWRLDPEQSQGLYGPLGQTDQVLTLKAVGPDQYEVLITANQGNWSSRDLYALDDKSHQFSMILPNGMKASGLRRARWAPPGQAVAMDEDIEIASLVGPLKVTRKARIYQTDPLTLVIESDEVSAMGHKTVRRVYRR